MMSYSSWHSCLWFWIGFWWHCLYGLLKHWRLLWWPCPGTGVLIAAPAKRRAAQSLYIILRFVCSISSHQLYWGGAEANCNNLVTQKALNTKILKLTFVTWTSCPIAVLRCRKTVGSALVTRSATFILDWPTDQLMIYLSSELVQTLWVDTYYTVRNKSNYCKQIF